MAYRKLEKVRDYLKAQTRSSALTSIDKSLDLGNGNTLSDYNKAIDKFKGHLTDYNTALSTADDHYNKALAQLAVLKDWNSRMLTGVGYKYGKDSSEYEMAGGKRKSERKKPERKAKKS